MESFITIKENITEQIIEKKSKFIAKLYYVETQKEIEEITKKVKKEYFDARHHCVAYRIIEGNSIIERANDDGEPSGTAGAPMLKILQNNNLCNLLIIVIRYFGGTLLGTGGLVKAYSESVTKALEKSEKVEKCIGEEVEIEIEYSDLEKIKYYCEKRQINITNIEYAENIKCILELSVGQINKIIEELEIKSINIKNYRTLNKKFIIKSR